MINIQKTNKSLAITARCDTCCDIVLQKNYAIHPTVPYQDGRNVNLIINYMTVTNVLKWVGTYLIEQNLTVTDLANDLKIECRFCYRSLLAQDVVNFEKNYPKND